MGMRIVHTADWHIGKNLNDYSLLDDQRYYFEQFVSALERISPEALIISGDIYDRSIPSAEAIALLNSILCKIVLELKISTYIIAGNHDSKERLSFAGELLSQSGLHIAGIHSRDIKHIVQHSKDNSVKVCFYLLPYIEAYNVKMLYPEYSTRCHKDALSYYMEHALQSCPIDSSCFNLLLAHGSFGRGIHDEELAVGGSEMIDSSVFEKFDYTAMGHLHSHRTAGADNMIYSGSPLKYAVDQISQEKSFCVLTVNKDKSFTLEREYIKPLRDVKIVTDSFNNLMSYQLSDDYIFVELTDEEVVFHAVARLKAVFPNILGLKYLALNKKSMSSVTSAKNVSKKDELELFADFYKSVTDKEITVEQVSLAKRIFDTIRLQKE